MKKWVSLVLGISMMVCFIGGCTQVKQTPKQELMSFLETLVSYEADVAVCFTSHKEQASIKMKQIYHMTGSYTLHITESDHMAGYETTYDGTVMEEYNPVVDKKVQAQSNSVRNQVLFGSFVHNYLEVGCTEEMIEEDEHYLTIELPIPGEHKYMAKEKVWFDKKTMKPVKMVIYDEEGSKRIELIFETFESKR